MQVELIERVIWSLTDYPRLCTPDAILLELLLPKDATLLTLLLPAKLPPLSLLAVLLTLLELLLPPTKNLDGLSLGAAEGSVDGLSLGAAEGSADGIRLGAAEGKFVKVDVISVIAPKSMLASMSLAIIACSMAF